MANMNRVYSFNDASPMLPSQVESEIFNIVNTFNTHNSGTAKWDIVFVKYGGAAEFISSDGTLVTAIKYTINNFTIIGDGTNGINLYGNVTLGETAGSFGGGEKVTFLPNAAIVPTTNPTGGGILYCQGGALKFRGSAGTVTPIAPA